MPDEDAYPYCNRCKRGSLAHTNGCRELKGDERKTALPHCSMWRLPGSIHIALLRVSGVGFARATASSLPRLRSGVSFRNRDAAYQMSAMAAGRSRRLSVAPVVCLSAVRDGKASCDSYSSPATTVMSSEMKGDSLPVVCDSQLAVRQETHSTLYSASESFVSLQCTAMPRTVLFCVS